MNKPRLRKLIKALRTEAGENMFDFSDWLSTGPDGKPPRKAFASGGKCGTTACVAGMAAVIDKAWDLDEDGYQVPSYNGLSGDEGFGVWAEITQEESERICYPHADLWPNGAATGAAEAADVLEHFVETGGQQFVCWLHASDKPDDAPIDRLRRLLA